MKKIFIVLSFFVLIFSGCKKDFDPQLYGTLSPTTFPSNFSEYELYTMDLYKPFYSRWGYNGPLNIWENNFFSPEWGHLIMFDGSSDLMAVFTNWGGFWQGFTSTDFTFMKTQGRGSHYEKVRFVTRATKIIDDLEKTTKLSADQKTALIAEAKMARGWTMYYLLHIYGPVPVILDPAKIATSAEADQTRPSRADFVSSIESDVRFAADNLPKEPTNYGRFNKGCALTVLMRLYLNEKNFVKAESVGREITPLGYSLVSNYASVFTEATEKNSETIWAVSCQNPVTTGNFNAFPFYCYPSNYIGNKIPSGWGGNDGGVFAANWKFYDSFDPSDTRRAILIPEYKMSKGSYKPGEDSIKHRAALRGAVIAKYADDGGLVNSVQGNDLVVCRYADVLLMLAEAINENSGPTAEAVSLVNQIRTRAGLLGSKGVSASESVSKDAFRDMLFIERGHELYFEGLRKMDLIRMNKVQSALTGAGKTVGPNYNLFPLPDYAISNSKNQLIQNDGY